MPSVDNTPRQRVPGETDLPPDLILPQPPRLNRLIGRFIALSDRIPLPAGLRRHISRGDAAFIAAAYAIPLPGTALFAALLVALKLGIRRALRRSAARRLAEAANV